MPTSFLDRAGFKRLGSMNDVMALSGEAFEYFSMFLLEQMEGYEKVRVTSKRGQIGADGGVDLTGLYRGEKFLGQCKKWGRRMSRGGKMPIGEIRALGGSMHRDDVTLGVFIATLPYSNTARREAKEMNIILIGPNDIAREMKRINPRFGKRQRWQFWQLLHIWNGLSRSNKRAVKQALLWLLGLAVTAVSAVEMGFIS